MISEEEKKAINDLKILCDEVLGQDDCYRYDNYSASEKMTMVSIVLNLVKTQNKMIEWMADDIKDADDCINSEFNDSEFSDYNVQEIIEHFRNKAKESENEY